MSGLALKLIAENKAAHESGDESAKRLDIGNCGLIELPEELLDCVWLEELVVSNVYWDDSLEKTVYSKNNGWKNTIKTLPSDIRKLKKLKILQLSGYWGNSWLINDISFLKELNQLQILDLGGNQISDISFLKELNQLQTLNLVGNQISDISFLKELTQLQTLNLSSNQISDISFLKELNQLQILDLGGNQIRDISFLKELNQLQTLHLGGNQISDISFLKELTQLQTLHLSNNQISDISFLKELTQLQTLHLSNNQISDISFLKELNQLQTLHLSNNQISDTSFLKELNQLQTLDLSNNQISDTSFLKELNQLQTLNLGGNQISDISFLKELNQLQTLDLSNNQISNTSFLKELNQLQTLYLSSNQISDISFLKELTQLQTLYLSRNQISDISFLKELTQLQTLHLSNNQISDINVLEPIRKILSKSDFGLDLGENPIVQVYGWKADWLRNYRELVLNELTKRQGVQVDIVLPAKILLLGNHESGKSSLLHFIQNKVLIDKKSDSTHVIKIEPYYELANIKKQFPDAIFFDFGGQDYYHGIYRAFISSGAFQILVWNNESDKNELRELDTNDLPTRNYDLSYWLGQKKYLTAQKSLQKIDAESWPNEMFVVQSRADKDHRLRKLTQEQAKDCEIKEEFHLSLNGEGEAGIDSSSKKSRLESNRTLFLSFLSEMISEYRRPIKTAEWYVEFLKSIQKTMKSEIAHQPVPLTKLLADYKDKVSENFSWETELETLHQQGMLLYYRDTIPGQVWLNPEALVKFIHSQILSKDFISKEFNGVVPFSRFEEIGKLNNDLTKLLLAEKVIFLHTHNPGGDQYIIPNYLPLATKDPDYHLLSFGIQSCVFVLKFDHFIPFGLINQMICFYGPMPDIKRFWRDQLLFTFEKKYKILIQLDFTELEIRLYASSELAIDEQQFFFYSIMALYWNEVPCDYLEFKKLISQFSTPDAKKGAWSEQIIAKKQTHRRGSNEAIYAMEMDEAMSEISKMLGRQESQTLTGNESELLSTETIGSKISDRKIEIIQRVFTSAPPDLRVSSNGTDFVNLKHFQNSLRNDPRIRKVVATSYKTASSEGQAVLEPMAVEVPVSSFQPFTLHKLSSQKKVFISYSHDDLNYRTELQKFLINLEREKSIEIWHDGYLNPGDTWDNKIMDKLKTADIVILLVSQNFISSTYIFEKELTQAMEKVKNRSRQIIPFLLKPCDFAHWVFKSNDENETERATGKMGNYQFLPQDKSKDARIKPLIQWESQEEGWMELVKAIRCIVGN